MKRLRLALVTRRFWPLMGGTHSLMANLACSLRDLDCDVNVVTAQWDKSWPTHFHYRDVPVDRLPQPRAKGWRSYWYMKRLASWLRDRRDSIDCVLVSSMRHDAHTAVRFGQRFGVPIVCRSDGIGQSGDAHWQSVNRIGKRVREQTKMADAWIVATSQSASELTNVGYPVERGVTIPLGATTSVARTRDSRRSARRSLAEAHSILTVPDQAPLVVYAGKIDETRGLIDLIDAWRPISRANPLSRLWIIGEGKYAVQLWDRIKRWELTRQIILPGSFDDLTEVLCAADAFVLPSYEEDMSVPMLEAMSVGCPVVASDIPGNRLLIRHEAEGRLFRKGDRQAITDSIRRVLSEPLEAEHFAIAARERVCRHFSIESMAERHIELIRRLIHRETVLA